MIGKRTYMDAAACQAVLDMVPHSRKEARRLKMLLRRVEKSALYKRFGKNLRAVLKSAV